MSTALVDHHQTQMNLNTRRKSGLLVKTFVHVHLCPYSSPSYITSPSPASSMARRMRCRSL